MNLNPTTMVPTGTNPSTAGSCGSVANAGAVGGTNFDEVLLNQSAPDIGDDAEKQPLEDGSVIPFALLTIFPQHQVDASPALPDSTGHDCSNGDEFVASSVPTADCLGRAQTEVSASEAFGVADGSPSFSSAAQLWRAKSQARTLTEGANFTPMLSPESLQAISKSSVSQFGIGPIPCASAIASTSLSSVPAPDWVEIVAPSAETTIADSVKSKNEGAVVEENQSTDSQPIPNAVEQSANVAGLESEAIGMRVAENSRSARKADRHRLGAVADSNGTAVAKGVRRMIETSNATSVETQDTVVASTAAERVSRRDAIQSAGPEVPRMSKDDTVAKCPPGDSEAQLTSAPTFTLDQRSLRAENTALTPAAVIHPAYRAITEVLQRVRPQGTEKMEIDVALADGENLKVRLEFHKGEIRTAFQTNNLEIQQALQRGWSTFSHEAVERGFRVSEATFDQSGSHSQLPFQNQGEQDRRQQGEPGSRWTFPAEQTAMLGRVSHKISETASTASGQVSLWA